MDRAHEGGGPNETLQGGDKIEVRAKVWLPAELTPDEVAVELYVGRVDAAGHLEDPQIAPMQVIGRDDGAYLFENASVSCRTSGVHGYTVRVLPDHDDLNSRFVPGLITWAGNGE